MTKAHVSITFNEASTVCTNASDILLFDNDFNTLVMSILAGRNIIQNIKKYLSFYLISNISIYIACFIGIILTGQIPFACFHLIWFFIIIEIGQYLILYSNFENNNEQNDNDDRCLITKVIVFTKYKQTTKKIIGQFLIQIILYSLLFTYLDKFIIFAQKSIF